LPDIIQFKNGNQVINTYTANGQKLRTKYYTAISSVVNPVIVPVGTIHAPYSTSDAILRLDDYMGNILYENGAIEDASNHPLTKVLTPEGYVDYATPGKPYCYFRKDHLGSIREVDSYQGNNRTVVQKTQYYPSGTPFQESYGAGEQPYKFTGKEMITMHGLNWQDYDARWLDNAGLQFTSVDPLAENHYDVSPYAYCMNNPINNIDPLGLDTVNVNTPTPIKKGDVMVDNKGVIGTASSGEAEVKPDPSDYFYIFIGQSARKSVNNLSAAGSFIASFRYMERPWGSGYFKTLKGVEYPLSVLKPQANGKFLKGIQGIRNGAQAARMSVRLLTRTLNVVNKLQIGYDTYKFIQNSNFENGTAVVIDGVSYAFWEVGVVSAGVQGMVGASSGEREQIQNNIENNENPMNNVYVPGLGTTY